MNFYQASLFLVFVVLLTPHWTIQQSNVSARLRGVSAVSESIAWASGSSSTVLRTSDGGASWEKISVSDEQLDFRDIDAIDQQNVYVLSIGNGPASRIYKSNDGGRKWELQFRNDDPKVFLDAMSFWDADHGVVIGDSINCEFFLLTTSDGGQHWTRVPSKRLPQALDNEGAFAASGTNIATLGKTDAWIGLGAATKARVLHTSDGGQTWTIAETPLVSGPQAGIFSITYRDTQHGVIVGGNYTREEDAISNLAITNDGGATWKLQKGLTGFRSAVAYLANTKVIVAVGPGGSDYSADDGQSWQPLPGRGFDTLSLVKGKSIGWACGAQGSIGQLIFTK